jgi:dTDP-4-dehydrorhamnose 3,5-epimerase
MSFENENKRGMHIQSEPFAQAKLVQVLQGEVYDVAVDLRKDSKTYKQWHAEVLSESNMKVMYIPEGFAHTFLVLSDFALFFYKCSTKFSPEHNITIRWDDKDINVQNSYQIKIKMD